MPSNLFAIFASLAFVFQTGCATTDPKRDSAATLIREQYGENPNDIYLVNRAIDKKNHELLRLAIEANDESFLTQLSHQPTNWLNDSASDGDWKTFFIIAKGASKESLHDSRKVIFADRHGSCRNRAAEILLDLGVRLEEGDSYQVTKTSEHLCTDTIRLIISTQNNFLPAAINGFENRIERELLSAQNTDLPRFWNAESHGKVDQFAKQLTKFAKEVCKGSPSACPHEERINATLAKYMARAEKAKESFEQKQNAQSLAAEKSRLESEFADSEEGRLQKICQIIRIRKGAEERITHQKKIGQKSGVINQKILHDAGNQAVAAEEWLESHSKGFQEKFGKKPDLKKCN